MPRIRVSTLIRAPRVDVWDAVRDIASHVRWMEDAEAIRITSPKQSGVGTTFECDSRLGPLRLTDRMEVSEWRTGRAIGIRHFGTVAGTGRFLLRRRRRDGILFTWEERLTFPWWLGGSPVGFLVGLFLRRVWKRNLANLKTLVESGRVEVAP